MLKEYLLTSDVDAAQIGRQTYAITLDNDNVLLRFPTENGKQNIAINGNAALMQLEFFLFLRATAIS